VTYVQKPNQWLASKDSPVQSGLGIASFVISIPPFVAGAALLLLLVWFQRNGGMAPTGYQAFGFVAYVLFYSMYLCIPCAVTCVGLAIASLIHRVHKQHFAIAAICISVTSIILWLAAIVVSMQ
jgi:hypothetical protein